MSDGESGTETTDRKEAVDRTDGTRRSRTDGAGRSGTDRTDRDNRSDRDSKSARGDRANTDATSTRIALAQGTFDILHPGHLHYLREAAAHGDELHVIVARRDNVTHKAKPVCPDRQRRDMVDALAVVDEAHLGHPEDFFVPVREIDPHVIVLGFDQHHDETALAEALSTAGIDAAIARATGREPRYDGELLSTGDIIDKLIEERT